MRDERQIRIGGAVACFAIVLGLGILRQYAAPESFLEYLQIMISFAGALLLAGALLRDKQTVESMMVGPLRAISGGFVVGIITGTVTWLLEAFPWGSSLCAGLVAMLFVVLTSLWWDTQVTQLREDQEHSTSTS